MKLKIKHAEVKDAAEDKAVEAEEAASEVKDAAGR